MQKNHVKESRRKAIPQLKIAARYGYPVPPILAYLVTRQEIRVPGTYNGPQF